MKREWKTPFNETRIVERKLIHFSFLNAFLYAAFKKKYIRRIIFFKTHNVNRFMQDYQIFRATLYITLHFSIMTLVAAQSLLR